MQALFWISLALLFYTYLGYGLALLLLASLRRKKVLTQLTDLPAVTFVVPAFNEDAIIIQKIENTLALQYPPDKLTLLFVTDGSTDDTPAIVDRYPRIQHLHQALRQGKSAALNRAMLQVQTPIVVFSDANTLLEPASLQRLVQPFADAKVGGVSGEKRIWTKEPSAVGLGERLYWRYESLLKKANADFYTIVGAAGELFALRTALYQPLEEDVILDDFFVSARVCLQGYRFAYEAGAQCLESSSPSLHHERKRKVRISAGCYHALVRLPQLLNPLRNGRLAFQYLSHRVLRWVVCPLALPLLLLSNGALAVQQQGIYTWLLAAQLLFYALALLGLFLPARRGAAKALLVPHYFLFMVLSQYAGFLRFLQGRQSAVWEKLPRLPLPRRS